MCVIIYLIKIIIAAKYVLSTNTPSSLNKCEVFESMLSDSEFKWEKSWRM